jgi:hypothetical protein
MMNNEMVKLRIIICLFVMLNMAKFNVFAQDGMIERMPCFDFCGLEVALTNGHPFGKGNWFGTDEKNDISMFSIEPLRGLSSTAMNQVALNDYNWLYVHLVIAEAVGLAGNRKMFNSYGTAFCSLIQVYEKHSEVLGTFNIRRFRPKLEYMLARIINDRRPGTVKLLPADVRRILPPLSSKGVVWDENLWHSWRTHETFRRMLIVGSALEYHLRKFGQLPHSLETLDCVGQEELKDAYGKRFSYRRNKCEWMIFSCGKETERETPWDVYIPCVGITGGYATTETWFASSFSRKRQELYKSGCLNDAYPAYRCYMRGNVVYRGDGEGTKHPID